MPDPERFGVAEIRNGKLVGYRRETQAPQEQSCGDRHLPFDAQVFRIVKTLKPSDRGELEITDVNNAYIKMKTMTWEMLEGWWTDAGTFESLMRAAILVSQTGANNLS